MVLSGRDLMEGVIIGEPGFLIGVVQVTCNDVIKRFRNKELFTGQRYRKMEDHKPWPTGLASNQDFA